MTFNVSLKKTISCELNNAVVHTFVLSFRTQMLSNWPILPVAGAVRSYYRAASFLRLPETLFIASVWPARPRPAKTTQEHPIQPSASIHFCLASSLQADAQVRLVPSRSVLRICCWLTFPLQLSSRDSESVISVLLQRHPTQQIVSSACSRAIWRVSSWDLYKIMEFVEISGFYLYFGMRREHVQAANPCFA